MKKYKTSILLIVLFLLGVIGLILTMKTPFGFVFNMSLVFVFTGLIGFLINVLIKWFKRSIIRKVVAVTCGLLALSLTIVLLIASTDFRMLMPAVSSDTLTKAEWMEDFAHLKTFIQDHPGYRDSLNSRLNEYISKLQEENEINDHKALMIAMKMVSALKDGHSNLMPFQMYLKTRYIPIQIHEFADGLFIVGAAKNNKLIGGKIISMNGRNINLIIEEIHSLIGADHPDFGKYMSALYVPNMDVLYGLGVTTNTDEITLELEINGKLVNEIINSVSMFRWLGWSLVPNDEVRPVGTNIRNGENYIEIKNDSLIWMVFSKTGSQEELTRLGNNIRSQLYGPDIQHLVIDMRNNTGGSNSTYNELIESLAESDLNITLFTSRKTFSAAINFISELQLARDFYIIGEPTGAGHNHYGDARTIFLPYSGFMLNLSTKEWSFIPELKENTILPDIPIRYASTDYFNDVDPWEDAFFGR